MLQNLTIGKRLGYGFAALALLLVATGLFGAQRLGIAQQTVRTLTRTDIPAIRDLGRLATLLAEYRVSERGLVASAQDPAKAAEYAGELVDGRAAFETLAKTYAARIQEPRERTLYADVAAKATRYFENSRLLVEGLKVGDMTAAKQAGDLRQATADALAALLEVDMGRLRAAEAAQEAGYHANVWAITVLLLVALALAIAAAILITRSIVRPLAQVLACAQGVARGDLDRAIPAADHSELGRLAQAMREMVSTLRRFTEAQDEMSRRHDAGEIDYGIPAGEFAGAYARMAEGINTLVTSHIETKFKLVRIIGEYAHGDLSRDMERLPGKKAEITAAADAAKAQLLAINAEIKALVDAAVAGDFSKRGDAQRFQFVYRELIEGLNTLMATADGGLDEVGALLAALADGDLNRRVEGELPGQFGRLAEDANRSVEQLTQIVAQIRIGSDAINAAAGEIAAGNNDLSQRTEQQAASLEETASSMEELTSTVKQNADNARQANQLARGAADVAEQGGAVVGQVVHTMSAISDSSRKIADIIGVIDGIAFQTNILALNAAVEAARAGEQGRGFAVVASEVRSLAQRSANAAKEIKQLITDSVGKVEEGSQLVDRAGRTMGEIVTSVKRVTDIIADIAAASAEQSAGIEQVNVAITSMDEGTQQNAALVEEASASARSLEQQAEQLVTTVAVFRVDATRIAQLERPQAAVVELPRARKVAVAAARTSRAQGAAATDQWDEF